MLTAVSIVPPEREGMKMACNDYCEIDKPEPGPCPKCGGTPLMKVNTLTAWIRCTKCGYCVAADDVKNAIKAWEGTEDNGKAD